MHSCTSTLITLVLATAAAAAPATGPTSELLGSRSIASRFTGFRASPQQADGVYQVFLYDNGTESEHVKLHNHDHQNSYAKVANAHASQSHLFDRQATTLAKGADCAPRGAVMPEDDVKKALDRLGKMCDKGGEGFIPGRSSIYTKSGQTVAYVCNYSPNKQHCTSKEIDDAMDGVHRDGEEEVKGVHELCNTKAGWFYYFYWWKSYGYDDIDYSFCGWRV